jgi:hypothetical protein
MTRLHDFAKQSGLEVHGLHHEIYLSDPRRVAPAKLRTILRVPVKRSAISQPAQAVTPVL